MQLKDLKELEKLMRLCKKQGVAAIEIDNIKFSLSPEPATPASQWRGNAVPPQFQPTSFDPGTITADTKIITDELSEEDLLNWSVKNEV